MKDSDNTLLMLAGVAILVVFVYVSTINILPNNSSNSFYSKNESGLKSVIEDINMNNDKLIITTSNSDAYICAKQTKSKPEENSICWKKVEDNRVELSIYIGKTYYVWLKDSDGKISDIEEYNTNK